MEIRSEGERLDHPASHLYVGGGTPSLLEPNEIARLGAALRDAFDLRPVEATVEANPATLGPVSRRGRRGITRLSLGAQSLRGGTARARPDPPPRRRRPRGRRGALGRDGREPRPHLRLAGPDRGRLARGPRSGRGLGPDHLSCYPLELALEPEERSRTGRARGGPPSSAGGGAPRRRSPTTTGSPRCTSSPKRFSNVTPTGTMRSRTGRAKANAAATTSFTGATGTGLGSAPARTRISPGLAPGIRACCRPTSPRSHAASAGSSTRPPTTRSMGRCSPCDSTTVSTSLVTPIDSGTSPRHVSVERCIRWTVRVSSTGRVSAPGSRHEGDSSRTRCSFAFYRRTRRYRPLTIRLLGCGEMPNAITHHTSPPSANEIWEASCRTRTQGTIGHRRSSLGRSARATASRTPPTPPSSASGADRAAVHRRRDRSMGGSSMGGPPRSRAALPRSRWWAQEHARKKTTAKKQDDREEEHRAPQTTATKKTTARKGTTRKSTARKGAKKSRDGSPPPGRARPASAALDIANPRKQGTRPSGRRVLLRKNAYALAATHPGLAPWLAFLLRQASFPVVFASFVLCSCRVTPSTEEMELQRPRRRAITRSRAIVRRRCRAVRGKAETRSRALHRLRVARP